MQTHARTKTPRILTVLLITFCTAACASKPRAADPVPAVEPLPMETVEAFIRAMQRQDMAAVRAMLAEFDGVPEGAWQDELGDLERGAAYMASGEGYLVPVESKTDTGCAVVAVDERRGSSPQRPRDLEPFYLVKQGGVWRVMPEPTSYDDWPVLSQDQLAAFGRLEHWLEDNRDRLREASAAIDVGPWLLSE